MKKSLVIALVAVFAVAFAFSSCEKKKSAGCSCTVSVMGQSETVDYTADEMEAAGITCAELEAELQEIAGEYADYSCK